MSVDGLCYVLNQWTRVQLGNNGRRYTPATSSHPLGVWFFSQSSLALCLLCSLLTSPLPSSLFAYLLQYNCNKPHLSGVSKTLQNVVLCSPYPISFLAGVQSGQVISPQTLNRPIHLQLGIPFSSSSFSFYTLFLTAPAQCKS